MYGHSGMVRDSVNKSANPVFISSLVVCIATSLSHRFDNTSVKSRMIDVLDLISGKRNCEVHLGDI